MTTASPSATATDGPHRVPARFILLFTLLYAIQGVVFAYFGTFNQGYLKAAGVSERSINWIQSIVLLPFAFKFLAAPLSDRFNLLGFGHRKPYILIGLVLQGIGLLALGWLDPGASLGTFGAVALLTVAGLALYDTCTDGLVIDITPPGDRERVQGLLIFSRFFTATIMTWLFGQWLGHTGTGPLRGYGVLWACAALTLIPLVLGTALREPRRLFSEGEFSWKALGVLIRPRSLVLLAFGTFYAIVSWGVEMNLPLFYAHLDYGTSDIGTFGSALKLGRALGALAMPVGVAWMGRRWALRLAVLALAGSELAQVVILADQPWTATLMAFGFGLANGWTEAMFFVLAMEASDPRMAASTYALFMAVTNLSVLGSVLFSEAKVQLFHDAFPPTFMAAAGLTLVALFLIGPLSRPAPGRPDGSPADA